MNCQVVIAWTETVEVPDGTPVAVDLGVRRGFRSEVQAHVCMWLRKGEEADAVRARAYMASDYPETGRVFTYPTSEQDPLGRARVDVLAKGT